MQAIQQIADDSFFIAGGNEHRKTLRGCGRKALSPAEKRNRDIDKLIGIANKKQNGNGLIDGFKCQLHGFSLRVLGLL